MQSFYKSSCAFQSHFFLPRFCPDSSARDQEGSETLGTKVWVGTLSFSSELCLKFLLGPDWEWFSLLPAVLKARLGLTPSLPEGTGSGNASCPSPGQECAVGSLGHGAELRADALINAAAGLVLLERSLSSRDIKY